MKDKSILKIKNVELAPEMVIFPYPNIFIDRLVITLIFIASHFYFQLMKCRSASVQRSFQNDEHPPKILISLNVSV